MNVGAFSTNTTIDLAPGASWTSSVMGTSAVSNAIDFKISKESQPTKDELVAEIVRNDAVLATASVPMWIAEPMTDRGYVRAEFDEATPLDGSVLRIRREASVGGPEADVLPAIVRLEAVQSLEGGTLRPDVKLRYSRPDLYFGDIIRGITNPQRWIGVPLASILVAVGLARVLERRNRTRGIRMPNAFVVSSGDQRIPVSMPNGYGGETVFYQGKEPHEPMQ